MILAIGGPMTKEPEKKPGFMKSKPRRIGGIGGEYAKEAPEESEGSGMSNEERMLEIARPLARSAGVPSQTVVDVVKGICELMMNNGEAEPAETEEESE